LSFIELALRLGGKSGNLFAATPKILSFSLIPCGMLPCMKTYIRPVRILFLMYLVSLLLSGPFAIAQEPGRELDDLSKRISKELSKTKIGSVVVADFVSLNGADTSEGRYLALEFSQGLERHKKNFTVTDPKQLSSALASAQILAKDLSAPGILQQIGTSLQVSAVVTGTIETTPVEYSVRVSVQRVSDGSLVVSADQKVKRPAYMDSLALLDLGETGPKVAKAGADGISIPICAYCPPPDYTDKARAERVQGRVVLLVVINQEGRAIRIAVTRANDGGLAAKAVDAVRKWKFKPATDKDGNAVAAIVPIEVSFSLR
jgi:TonB family protein